MKAGPAALRGAVVGGAVVLLVVLLVNWLASTSVRSSQQIVRQGESRTVLAPPPPADASQPVQPVPLADAIRMPEPAAPAAAAVDERIGLLVYGAITDSAGAAVSADGDVRFLPETGAALSARLDDAGTYALARLRPGTWTAKAELDGYRPSLSTLRLEPGQAATRFDIVVEPAVRLLIVAVTPEGRPLQDALRESLGPEGRLDGLRLCAVATLQPPEALQADATRGWFWYGEGRFFDHLLGGPLASVASSKPAALGWLDVRVPLPVHVSLILSGLVLGTQRVEPGQDEVVFRVAAADVTDRLASLSVRFVDALTQLPVEGARLSLSVADLDRRPRLSDADGRVHAERLLPGRVELATQRDGYELSSVQVVLVAGQDNDLGEVPLSPAATARGSVLDARGQPLVADIQVTEADGANPLHADMSSWRWTSEGDGSFELGPLGRRRYLLRVSDEDLTSAPVFADLREGDVGGLVLRAERGQPVSVHFAWPTAEQHDVRLRSVGAASWDDRPFCRAPGVWTESLGAGRYVVECCDGESVLQSLSFEVTAAPVDLTLTGR